MAQITARDAAEADVPDLTAIKGAGSEAIHRDRLRDARKQDLRYLLLSADDEVVGFAVLVFRRPAYWSDGGNTRHLPQIVDLRVKESERGKGYGTALIHAVERIAAEAGYGQLYLGVDPVNNPRAHALYRRLGYRQLQAEPYRETWEFKDSAGQVHHGEGWAVDMVKALLTISRRQATGADTDFARRVHHDAYRGVVVRLFGAWIEPEQDRFFAADWRPDASEIILSDGAPCGYFCLEDRGDDLHVREIVLRPEFQGRGIGTAILGEVVERARRRGVPVRLGALHENRAIQLYRRLGFREVGRTATHVLLEWRSSPSSGETRR